MVLQRLWWALCCVDKKVLRDHLWHAKHVGVDEKGDQRICLALLMGMTEEVKERIGRDVVDRRIAGLRESLAGVRISNSFLNFTRRMLTDDETAPPPEGVVLPHHNPQYPNTVAQIHNITANYPALNTDQRRELLVVWLDYFDGKYDKISAEMDRLKWIYEEVEHGEGALPRLVIQL